MPIDPQPSDEQRFTTTAPSEVTSESDEATPAVAEPNPTEAPPITDETSGDPRDSIPNEDQRPDSGTREAADGDAAGTGEATSPEAEDATAETAAPTADHDSTAAQPIDPADTLSPAVRRLVRQYDLDITGIHGTGPSGRIRVGDVIGMLGGRTEPVLGRLAGAAPSAPVENAPEPEGTDHYEADTDADTSGGRLAPMSAGAPTTTVFECDLSSVLAHRKRARQRGKELLLTSYYLAACTEALEAVPEVCVDSLVIGVALASTSGETRTGAVDASELGHVETIDHRLNELDDRLRAADSASRPAGLWIHHYGSSGSLLALPTPIAPGHSASLGIGAVRRQIALRATDDGDEAPRIAALCYLGLSFDPRNVTLERANLFLGQLVHTLEQWPETAS